MKVSLEPKYRTIYTLDYLDKAKRVIEIAKEDESTPKEQAVYAIEEALKGKHDYCVEILKANAYTARNCRVWDAFEEDTADMDIWIEATAETAEGFIVVGAYQTDIWRTGAEDYKDNMYIRYYTRADI